MATAFLDALRPAQGGFVLQVAVTAGAKETRFPDGYDPWRKRIGIRVTAPAEAGKANREVCRVVREFFGANDAEVQTGPTSSLKAVLVTGTSLDDAVARLSPEVR